MLLFRLLFKIKIPEIKIIFRINFLLSFIQFALQLKRCVFFINKFLSIFALLYIYFFFFFFLLLSFANIFFVKCQNTFAVFEDNFSSSSSSSFFSLTLLCRFLMHFQVQMHFLNVFIRYVPNNNDTNEGKQNEFWSIEREREMHKLALIWTTGIPCALKFFWIPHLLFLT